MGKDLLIYPPLQKNKNSLRDLQGIFTKPQKPYEVLESKKVSQPLETDRGIEPSRKRNKGQGWAHVKVRGSGDDQNKANYRHVGEIPVIVVYFISREKLSYATLSRVAVRTFSLVFSSVPVLSRRDHPISVGCVRVGCAPVPGNGGEGRDDARLLPDELKRQ